LLQGFLHPRSIPVQQADLSKLELVSGSLQFPA